MVVGGVAGLAYAVSEGQLEKNVTVSAILVLLILFIHKHCSNPLAQLNVAKYTRK